MEGAGRFSNQLEAIKGSAKVITTKGMNRQIDGFIDNNSCTVYNVVECCNEFIFCTKMLECSCEIRYTFYDGPPFATGLPHYGHILAGTIKVSIRV